MDSLTNTDAIYVTYILFLKIKKTLKKDLGPSFKYEKIVH